MIVYSLVLYEHGRYVLGVPPAPPPKMMVPLFTAEASPGVCDYVARPGANVYAAPALLAPADVTMHPRDVYGRPAVRLNVVASRRLFVHLLGET